MRMKPGYLQSTFGDTRSDLNSLISQWNQLTSQVSGGSNSAQIQTILQRQTTSGPSQTVSGIIKWYSNPSVGGGGQYETRDSALLSKAVGDLTALVNQQTATPTIASPIAAGGTSGTMAISPAVAAPLAPQMFPAAAPVATDNSSLYLVGGIGLLLLILLPLLLRKKHAAPTQTTITKKRKRKR